MTCFLSEGASLIKRAKNVKEKTRNKKEKQMSKLPDQFQDDIIDQSNEVPIDYNQGGKHKCSVCGIVKELFVFNKYTQICGDCYCEESTRLAKEYYADIKAQENLRLQIRKSIDEQNNHQRRMEGEKP